MSEPGWVIREYQRLNDEREVSESMKRWLGELAAGRRIGDVPLNTLRALSRRGWSDAYGITAAGRRALAREVPGPHRREP